MPRAVGSSWVIFTPNKAGWIRRNGLTGSPCAASDDARTLHNLGLVQVRLGVGALRGAQKRYRRMIPPARNPKSCCKPCWGLAAMP
ncbi:MAG: hypothetical protein IPL59_16755 [Candidatus Competibacteraceae bacterium]|nr:hypothetical protein [Candidatus Competibacteraceae bacterium]